MRSGPWPVITVPLAPYIKPGLTAPIPTRRLRPADAANLGLLLQEFEASTVAKVKAAGRFWSVVSVFSPYSHDVHVMLIEASPDRYVPGPERIAAPEGEALLQLWREILVFMRQRPEAARAFVGYNWSPRSWGEEEEKGGFQSVPTKWHPMLWSWPAFPEQGKESEYVSWIGHEDLSPVFKRIFGDNNYVAPLARLIKDRVTKVLTAGGPCGSRFDLAGAGADSHGAIFPFEGRLEDLLAQPGFFAAVLKPAAVLLDRLFSELAECFTNMDCGEIDRILARVQTGPLCEEDFAELRRTPQMRPAAEIGARLTGLGLPADLVDTLSEPIRLRCCQTGDTCLRWRKGFGYALVFGSGPGSSARGELRIMPGVCLGPGGVIEAQGVVLKRPEDSQLPQEVILRKSSVLHQLSKVLPQEIDAPF